MKSHRIIRILLTGCLVAALISGCGNGGGDGTDSSDGASASLTKSQFLQRANSLCKKNVEEQAAVAQQFIAEGESSGETVPVSAIETLAVEKIYPVAKQMVRELDGLQEPPEYTDKVAKLVRSFEEAFELAEESPSEYWAGRAFSSPDALADSYGLTSCGV